MSTSRYIRYRRGVAIVIAAVTLCGVGVYVRKQPYAHETKGDPTSEPHDGLGVETPRSIVDGFSTTPIVGSLIVAIFPTVVSGASGGGSSRGSSSGSGGGDAGGGGDQCASDQLTNECGMENAQEEAKTCSPGDSSCARTFKNYSNPRSEVPYERNDGKGEDKGKGSKGKKSCKAAKDSGDCAQKCGKFGFASTPDVSSTGLSGQYEKCGGGSGGSDSYMCRQKKECNKEGGGGEMPCIPMPSQQEQPQKKQSDLPANPCESPFASKIAICNKKKETVTPPSCPAGAFSASPTKIYAGEAVDLRWSVTGKGTLSLRIKYVTKDSKGKLRAGTLGTVKGDEPLRVFPERTTSYTLIAKNEGGAKTCPLAKVEVTPTNDTGAFVDHVEQQAAPEDTPSE